MSVQSESCLLYLDTAHAKSKTPSTGRHEFNIGNALFTNKVVRAVPLSITVPNIFPNVNSYRNAFNDGSAIVVPVGQYTLTSLITAINAVCTAAFTWGVNTDGYVTISHTSTGTVTIDANSDEADFLSMLGFGESTSVTVTNPTLTTAPNLPNLGGEKTVFIMCDKLAHSNCIYGHDGKPYDVFSVVSLADTAYGQSVTHRSNDGNLDDIEFKYHNNLDSLVVELLDSKFRKLPLPENYHVHMVIKIYHRDGQV